MFQVVIVGAVSLQVSAGLRLYVPIKGHELTDTPERKTSPRQRRVCVAGLYKSKILSIIQNNTNNVEYKIEYLFVVLVFFSALILKHCLVSIEFSIFGFKFSCISVDR